MDEIALSTAEEQLKNFGTFLQTHDKKLHNLLNTALGDASKSLLREPIIELNYSANQEQITLLKLLESERALNKTLLTFGNLCAEVESLVNDARQKELKFLYIDAELLASVESENGSASAENAHERTLLKMSQSIEFLCSIQFLLQRCKIVGNNLLHQCGAFYACEGVTMEFCFFNVFDSIAQLLQHILIFDAILATSRFYRFWPTYKKTLEAIGQNPNLLSNSSAAEVNGLLSCLLEFDVLFSGNIFQDFLGSTFTLKEKIGPKGMSQLTQQFNDYLKQNLAQIDKLNPKDCNEFCEPLQLVRLNAFCVLFHDFCGQVDTKHVKHLLELNAKHQGIMLIGNVPWTPMPFLRKHAETLVKPHARLLEDAQRLRQNFLGTRVRTLQRDCRAYCMQITLWTINVQKRFQIGAFDLKVSQFKELTTLLLLGLRYAGQISFLVKALINTHVLLQMPMTKQTLLDVCKLIEMLRVMQTCLQTHMASIAKVMQCVLQYLQYKVSLLLNASKKKISASKLQERNVDALAALKIAEKCLAGSPSNSRLLVLKLAVNATNAKQFILTHEQTDKFNALVQRIELLANFQLHVQQVCDVSFIYWHQALLSAYLRQVVSRKMDFNSFQRLVAASNSCGKTFELLQLNDTQLAETLKQQNFERVRTEIISNLCAQIETFLRLEVHANLQLNKLNPFVQSINDYRDLTNSCAIELNGNYIILKDYVENYLGAMFYNLTTISLHDWKTYEEMRHLANTRLNLKPVEDYLPNQTLEQGIDILEIMRKIHIFVTKYTYNMNSQIFVEHQSSNKHLDSIGIRHVANSLRTHGTGIINTTVNFTYQFLRQKFYTFSQFLYDEQIKSRLMKELRAYAECKNATNERQSAALYAYERADAFNKDIRKLGLSADGQTYMDLFRRVITQVGNAMGYIRLVHSGSFHANYSGSSYLPKFQDELNFAAQCKAMQLHAVTNAAAENLEVNISNLAKSFSGTDYFKLLVEAFQPFFRNPHNIHLKNFFLIVPALTLNYVEHMLSAKEKINRKNNRHDSVLFDDGFAIGLAYILKLLNQLGDFNALQWFATVRERFEAEKHKIQAMHAEIKSKNLATKTSSGKKDKAKTQQNNENEKLQQTLALTEHRINAHKMEYNLLYYKLSSAKIFYQ